MRRNSIFTALLERNRIGARGFALGALALFIACQPATRQDVQDLQQQVAALAKKVDSLGDKIGDAPARRPSPPPEDFDKVYDIRVGDAPVYGPKDAPVTLVEYSDFQCPFCARARPLLRQIADKYPDKVRLVFKHFPLSFHPAAGPAALASMAAQDQGKFWEFHDVLFDNNSTLDGSAKGLEGYAEKAGLDVERFKRDLEQNRSRYQERVVADMRQGQEVDVRGTPTLYVNGKKMDPRLRSMEGMTALIDSILEESSG